MLRINFILNTLCFVQRSSEPAFYPTHTTTIPMQCDYTLCDTQLAQVNQNHYLGVLLSDDAKWWEHINK